MIKKEEYPLVDIFRIIAAILVVAIHTFPLQSIDPALDFYLTKGVGRIAVPFFFMTTAYFYFLKPTKQRLIKILKQYSLIYFIAIVIYFPLNLYNLCFLQNNLLLEALKAIIFDGTFYHLWYLPATIIGLIIMAILHKYVSSKTSLVVVTILYLIGLGGDSYFGLVTSFPGIRDFYYIIFSFCDYTRNGIFMAPMFLWLGKYLANYKSPICNRYKVAGLLVSMALMLIEISKLKELSWPRHDAMYLTMPIVMFFLYLNLIKITGRRIVICKDLALLIYVIHPWMIVIVRLVSKLIHFDALIYHSLVHFAAVTFVTILISLMLLKIRRYCNERKNNPQLD